MHAVGVTCMCIALDERDIMLLTETVQHKQLLFIKVGIVDTITITDRYTKL